MINKLFISRKPFTVLKKTFNATHSTFNISNKQHHSVGLRTQLPFLNPPILGMVGVLSMLAFQK